MSSQLADRVRSVVVLLLAAGACKDGPTELEFGPPARVEVTAGGTFSGVVGTRLETPLAVRVVDAQGRAVGGAIVRFGIVEGPGSVDPQSAVTGRTGHAARIAPAPRAGIAFLMSRDLMR
jgi:hypothetical protein